MLDSAHYSTNPQAQHLRGQFRFQVLEISKNSIIVL